MIEIEVTVKNSLGIHARPAAMIVRTAGNYQSKIMLSKDDMEVNGKSIMGVMILAAEKGSILNIKANGPDEKEAVLAIKQLFDSKFDEE